jgi:hypothetical protein
MGDYTGNCDYGDNGDTVPEEIILEVDSKMIFKKKSYNLIFLIFKHL